jgi:hypothetical protein
MGRRQLEPLGMIADFLAVHICLKLWKEKLIKSIQFILIEEKILKRSWRFTNIHLNFHPETKNVGRTIKTGFSFLVACFDFDEETTSVKELRILVELDKPFNI